MQRSLDALAVLRFVLEPGAYLARERQLRKPLPEPGHQAGFECGAVQARRLIWLDSVHRAALHEQAFYRVQRRKLRVARRQRLNLGRDAEQRGGKVLQMRRDGDQKFGFRLLRQRVGLRTGRDQAFGQGRVTLPQIFQERRIDASEPGTRIQIGKGKAECKHMPECGAQKSTMLP